MKLYKLTDSNTLCEITECTNKSYLKEMKGDKAYKHIYCQSHMKMYQERFGVNKKTKPQLQEQFDKDYPVNTEVSI